MRLLIRAVLAWCICFLPSAMAQGVQSDFNLEELSAEEAWRLLYVTPQKSPSPPEMILQWEDQRGGIKLYLTNRGAEPVVVDWGGSQFVDAAGQTWSIRSKEDPEASTAHVKTGELLEARLLLVSGPCGAPSPYRAPGPPRDTATTKCSQGHDAHSPEGPLIYAQALTCMNPWS